MNIQPYKFPIPTKNQENEVDLFKLKNICYFIINTVTNKIYIGASKNPFYSRYPFNMNNPQLMWATHSDCDQLKADVLLYGYEKFIINIICHSETPTRYNFFLEAFLINYLSSHPDIQLYNSIIPIMHHFQLKKTKIIDTSYVKSIENKCNKIFDNKLSILNITVENKNLKCNKSPFVEILCNECQCITKKSVNNLLSGRGCNKCRFITKESAFKKFVQKANIKFNNLYSYEIVKNNTRKVIVTCKKCKKTSCQTRNSHLKKGCQFCKRNENIENHKRKVAQIDIVTDNVIKIYPSINDAATETGSIAGNIPTVCNGHRNQTGGFKWKYV